MDQLLPDHIPVAGSPQGWHLVLFSRDYVKKKLREPHIEDDTSLSSPSSRAFHILLEILYKSRIRLEKVLISPYIFESRFKVSTSKQQVDVEPDRCTVHNLRMSLH